MEKHCHSTEEDLTVSVPVDDAMQCCVTHHTCQCFAIDFGFDRIDGSSVVSNQASQEDDPVPCCHLIVTEDFGVWQSGHSCVQQTS